MSTCLMIIYARIDDPAGFKAYAQATPGIVAQYGGRYRVLNGNPQVLEGDWPYKTTAVSEWPSRDAALAFWNSSEYAAAKELRAGKGDFQVVLLDQLPGA